MGDAVAAIHHRLRRIGPVAAEGSPPAICPIADGGGIPLLQENNRLTGIIAGQIVQRPTGRAAGPSTGGEHLKDDQTLLGQACDRGWGLGQCRAAERQKASQQHHRQHLFAHVSLRTILAILPDFERGVKRCGAVAFLPNSEVFQTSEFSITRD